ANSTLIFTPSGTSNGRKRGSLNDNGQVVFRFDLNDGRRGIAVGNPLTTATASCVGDCDGGGDVTVNEIITMVGIALGSAPLSTCRIGDADASGDISVNEIIKAVGFALRSCPAGNTSAA